MLTRAMIDQARRVAWRYRPRMSGARARAWARADRETFGISREGTTAETGGTRREAELGGSPLPLAKLRKTRRVLPPLSSDEAGRNEAPGRRRFWWEGRED